MRVDRTSRNPIVLSKVNSLTAAFPEARQHRETLKLVQSDFVYASSAPLDGPFAGVWLGLIRLSEELEERFGIHQEIPTIYSPHSDIQSRTIVRIPEMLELLPPERQGYAEGITFFWAPDVRLQTKLQKFSKTERVLIPMQSGDSLSFVTALSGHLYSQDLYRERTYVTGDQFFGRRSLLADLRGDLYNHRVPAVFGTRKTGKTSILKELVRTSQAGGGTDLIEIFVYQDLEHLPQPSSGADPIPELLGDLVGEIHSQLKLRKLRTKEMSDVPASPTLLEFRKALKATLQHPSNCQLNLVLILDEVEHLCPPNANEAATTANTESIPQFFGVLRKLVQENDNFDFVVAGLASAIVESGELYGRLNPLFRLANVYYMSPFNEREAEELLQGIGSRIGLRWLPGAISLAHAETGGQVVLLRELAAHVWETQRKNSADKVEVSEQDVDAVISGYRRAVRAQINETIDHVKRYYPEEFELCGEIIAAPTSFDELVAAYPAQVNRLINLGLIQEVDGRWQPTQVLRLGWSGAVVIKSSPTEPLSIQDLIKQGESRHLEFKSSVRTPMANEVAENVVVESLMKALLGFLNADGGKLLAGVNDDGKAIGLEVDIKRTNRSKDNLLRYVVDKMSAYLGQSVCTSIVLEWHLVDDKQLLLFRVPASDQPIFPIRKVDGKEDLFVRQNANVVPLSGAELYRYCSSRFSKG